MRPDDSHEVSQLNELKIDVSALCVGAHYALAGVNVMRSLPVRRPVICHISRGSESVYVINIVFVQKLDGI